MHATASNDSACLLVLNCGSSSIKFALFDGEGRTLLGKGGVSGVGVNAVLSAKGPVFENGAPPPPVMPPKCPNVTEAAQILIGWLEACIPPRKITAVGHRVVHGGKRTAHARVTPALLDELRALIPLAPLHEPYNIAGIEILQKLHPHVPQVACFDTAFHTTVPALHKRFALPREWHDKGVQRYGFHGLSYEYIASRLHAVAPHAFKGRSLVAHLGNGSSLCGLKGGTSFETSMGFSALDGLVMGTRTGALDPEVIFYMLHEAGLSRPEVETILWKKSGLLGVSGLSSDMGVLLASDTPHAAEAVDLFCWRLTREAGGIISLLGGLDSLVFTAGIGEHAVAIRARVAKSLAWTGMALDPKANANVEGKGEVLISTHYSPVEIWVIPTDEEGVIARHTKALTA